MGPARVGIRPAACRDAVEDEKTCGDCGREKWNMGFIGRDREYLGRFIVERPMLESLPP